MANQDGTTVNWIFASAILTATNVTGFKVNGASPTSHSIVGGQLVCGYGISTVAGTPWTTTAATIAATFADGHAIADGTGVTVDAGG